MILEKFPFGPLDTNAILLGCSIEKKAIIIDPAMGSAKKLLSEIAKRGLTLQAILLTHSHWDHIADVHELKLKTKAPIYIHPADAPNLQNPGSDRLPIMTSIQGEMPDHFLSDGEKIHVGTLILEVIHTPGHSPGGVCFLLRKEKVLISGDTLFAGTMGNLHSPTGQPLKMWESLRRLAELDPNTRVIPGHGKDTKIGDEPWLARAQSLFEKPF